MSQEKNNSPEGMPADKELIDSYDGFMAAKGSNRSYLDIEDGISVRQSFDKSDYYKFREGERPPSQDKKIIARCMNAYDKVGIIKNIIDLMGDFGSQGISLVHRDKNAQKFYRRWWDEVNGSERSERYLNNLFRCGNVVIKRRWAKLNKATQKQMTRGEDDVIITNKNISRRRIPFVYDFMNPLTIDVVGGQAALFSGDKRYRLKISSYIKKAHETNDPSLRRLPEDIKKSLKDGSTHIDLDPDNLFVSHYKKDDWQVWASPMVNSILDDITMLEKMKLADMAALDGAISNVRLWNVGDFEHKVLPTKQVIDKLKNVLAGNVGGGTMDLVWGPELSFTESNSQVYKFLGSEKYQPVLNSIYAGLGIPPTLTGIAGSGGGFTNNFISLKTLIERLEYGRNLLNDFWMNEIRIVQKAMGFNEPASIHFDHMILSDEAAEKNLLVQLADRDVISTETLRERFGESSPIEDARLKTEKRSRKSEKVPQKAGPYHNPHVEEEYKKIALNKGEIGIDQVTKLKPRPQPEQEKPTAPLQEKKKKGSDSEQPGGGRPKNSVDTKPRKQKVVKPRTSAEFSNVLIWATKAQKKISDLLQPALLENYGKSNVRKLTKLEAEEMELSKFVVLAKMSPFQEINEFSVLEILETKAVLSQGVMIEVEKLLSDYVSENSKTPSVEDMRQIYCLAYSYTKSQK
jgi:hypothetical protein